MASRPFDHAAKWVAAKPDRPKEMLDLIDEGVADADAFLAIALRQGVEVDREHFLQRAYDFVQAGTVDQQRRALFALGQILFAATEEWAILVRNLQDLLATDPPDGVRASLLSTAAEKLVTAPSPYDAPIGALCISILRTGGSLVLFEAARALTHVTPLPDDVLSATIEAFAGVPLEDRGTINTIDYALYSLLAAGHSDQVRGCIESLLLRQDGPLEASDFNTTLGEVGRGDAKALETWSAAWLSDGQSKLCKALNDSVFETGNDRLMSAMIWPDDLDDAMYAFIARKIIATFFLKPELMASFLVSLIRSAPESAREALASLLADPVLVNYSGIAQTVLKPVADTTTDPASVAIQSALAQREEYLAGLQSIGNVPELYPSERERRMEMQRHSDSMSKAFKDAREKSTLLQLVSHTTLLHGNSSISRMRGITGSGEERRIETPLASIGHSFEYPRGDIVDPLGLQLMLHGFAMEPRPQ